MSTIHIWPQIHSNIFGYQMSSTCVYLYSLVFTCTLCTESTASTFLSLTTKLGTISSRMLTHVYRNKNKIENHMHTVINYNYSISSTIIWYQKTKNKSQEYEDPPIVQVVLRYGTKCICVYVLYAHSTSTCQFNKYMSLTIGSKLDKVVDWKLNQEVSSSSEGLMLLVCTTHIIQFSVLR